MANPEHLKILQQGVEQWNKWRKQHPNVTPDLSQEDLSGWQLSGANLGNTRTMLLESTEDFGSVTFTPADLYEVDLSGADLSSADLSGADMRGSEVRGANLRAANIERANLDGVDLQCSDLTMADLSCASLLGTYLRKVCLQGALLYFANFVGTDLMDAVFDKAIMHGTHFGGVDLSVAIGLETVEHRGPCTIGIETIYESRGKIPEVFLRGCGVPDEFIAYIGSMVGRPIEFYSCFISYSTKDQEFAERLHADLQAKGVRCWFAPEEMKAGRKLHEQIDEAIRLHDKLLLILSEHSMSSNWVKTEIANAREREKREGKQLLFPITLVPFEAIKQWKLFDADIGIDSAREIREYFIPDFSNWKDHDSYQEAFQRLVKDLKAGARG